MMERMATTDTMKEAPVALVDQMANMILMETILILDPEERRMHTGNPWAVVQQITVHTVSLF